MRWDCATHKNWKRVLPQRLGTEMSRRRNPDSLQAESKSSAEPKDKRSKIKPIVWCGAEEEENPQEENLPTPKKKKKLKWSPKRPR